MKTNTTRTSKKWIAILLTVSCLLLTICSCSPSESGNNSDPVDESPDPGSGIETETYKIGVCSPNNGVPFFSRLIAGMEDKAAELGGKYVLDIVDANDDTNTQINQVETFIAQEVDFIVMMPTQVEALIPVAQECNAAGIPFITINRTLTAGDIADTGVDMITYVGADDYLGGQRLGELVEEMTGGEGNICFIQGTLGASFSELRQDGCEDYLAEHCPNVKIIDYQCSNQDQNTAMSIVDNWLVRYGPGEIDGIVGTSTWDAHGAADAIDAAGRDDMHGKVISFDYPPETLQAIQDGRFFGAVIQAPYDQGYIGMEVIDQYFTEGRDNIEANTWTELPTVTLENLDEHSEPAW